MYDNNLRKEVMTLKMVRMLIQLPVPLKRKLEVLRAQGTTASGFIRFLLEREFRQVKHSAQKGR